MKIDRTILVFDAADLAAESAFWAAVLDGHVEPRDDWHKIIVDGQAKMAIQLAPDHVPPQWPAGTPQQAHLDLWVEDHPAAHNEVMRLSATLLKPVQTGGNFQVYADPAGHPFCLCWVSP